MATAAWIISLLLCLAGTAYAGWSLWLYIGYLRTEQRSFVHAAEAPCLSILIAARNEEVRIGKLLQALARQDYDKSKMEIIIADDVSEDHTVAVVEAFAARVPAMTIRLLRLDESTGGSKKTALRAAVRAAKHDLLLITDADCEPGPAWVPSMSGAFSRGNFALLCGPVRIMPAVTIREQLEALEFLSLVASGAAMHGWGRPVLANAANLAVRRDLFGSAATDDPLSSSVSGDDMALLFAAQRNPALGPVGFLADRNALVTTLPQPGLSAFLQQRFRWVSKARHYRDPWAIMAAIWVFSFSLLLLLSPGLAFAGPWWLIAAAALFMVKCIADLPLLNRITRFSGQQRLLRHYLLLQCLYPLYVVGTAVGGLIGKFSWKGRKIKD